MYRIIKFISFFLLFTTSYFLLATNASAKDYSIKTADFKVQLQEDGSAEVTETRTYYFDGSYSWADEWIDLSSKCKVQSAKFAGGKLPNYQFRTLGGGSKVY